MAGRYVVIEFDDRSSAESFVANKNLPETLGFEVKAMYLSPDKFCECPDKRRQNNNNWARGSRSGIWLCKTCKKPSRFHQAGLKDRLIAALGFNLLER